MGYIRGEGREQGTLFPVVLDDLVPADHVCRVIDAFVDGLSMSELGFERAEAAETGRPGYDPRDLLKLYVYGYLHTVRSFAAPESGVPPQRGVDVASGTALSEPQVYSRVPAGAPRCGHGGRLGVDAVRKKVWTDPRRVDRRGRHEVPRRRQR